MKQNKLAGLVSLSLIKPVETDAEGLPVAEMDYYNVLYSQIQNTNMPGVSHDGKNQFFVEIADGWESEQYLNIDDLIDDELPGEINCQVIEFAIGKTLISDSPVIIVGSFSIFKALFNRPLWQLWCCNFESMPALQSAYNEYFTDAVTLPDDLDAAKIEVRNSIVQLITNLE